MPVHSMSVASTEMTTGELRFVVLHSLTCLSISPLRFFLAQIEIKEGTLECPESHKVYVITNGVPNMLLNEDEVEGEDQ